jgi:hypothetical protein
LADKADKDGQSIEALAARRPFDDGDRFGAVKGIEAAGRRRAARCGACG